MLAFNHHYTIINLNKTKDIDYQDIKKYKKHTHNVWTFKECIQVITKLIKQDEQATIQVIVDNTFILHEIPPPKKGEKDIKMYISDHLFNSMVNVAHSFKF